MYSLDEAVATFNQKIPKKISINQLLQFALNGKIALSILYGGKARVYEAAGEDSIKDVYGWFDIPPRCFADIINHQQSNINTLFSHNSYSVLLEGISNKLTATVENIFIAEPRLNELISLNVDKAQYNARPQQQQRFQEDEILRIIKKLGFSANAIPKWKSGKPGLKAAVRKELTFATGVFDGAWERLRAEGRIKE